MSTVIDVNLERKMGAPTSWGTMQSFTADRTLRCVTTLFLLHKEGLSTQREQHVQSLQSGGSRTCVLKFYLLFEKADFQASSRDEGLEIRTFSQPL